MFPPIRRSSFVYFVVAVTASYVLTYFQLQQYVPTLVNPAHEQFIFSSPPPKQKSLEALYGKERAAESLPKLPDWLQEYIHWHSKERQNAKYDQHSPIQYLVLVCHKGTTCGGFADRIRGLPFLLSLAAETKRVLLIKWSKPHDLSHFLIPPVGGIDWRTTPELDAIIEKSEQTYRLFAGQEVTNITAITHEACINRIKQLENKTVIQIQLDRERRFLNHLSELFEIYSFDQITSDDIPYKFGNSFGDIFRVMFEPVPPLAHSINMTMSKLGLFPNDYRSTHIRARYPTLSLMKLSHKSLGSDKEGGFLFHQNLKLRNYAFGLSSLAIQCVSGATTTTNDGPIFLSTDSNDTAALVFHHLSHTYKAPNVTGITRTNEPLHFDIDSLETSHSSPQDFYSLFEDLLIMGGSSCVGFGEGSFGSLGAALIGNTCFVYYKVIQGQLHVCEKRVH